ncbi:GFA family protein [Thalassotalea nanhaiensis]|uniref:GFA family protein n=1 Tax=Thalassotalea nanhaiensis TaxID=3065648 RepID=A0ABY9TN37_9GAMM|nr:GFA family protein [Colwelliaceae bacterium SQ345]
MTSKGSCLCGSITFSVSKFEPMVGNCHCRMCRKFHGAAFSTFADVKYENFKWLSGESFLQSYRASNNTVRQFCKQCGSSLTFRSSNSDLHSTIEIALATLDDEVKISPDAHIFVESKVGWYSPNDDLPCFRQYRDSEIISPND